MENALAVARLLAALYPIISETIKALEKQFPNADQGAAKMAMFETTMQAVMESVTEIRIEWATMWPKLKKLAEIMVTLYNSLGIFKTTKA